MSLKKLKKQVLPHDFSASFNSAEIGQIGLLCFSPTDLSKKNDLHRQK